MKGRWKVAPRGEEGFLGKMSGPLEDGWEDGSL